MKNTVGRLSFLTMSKVLTIALFSLALTWVSSSTSQDNLAEALSKQNQFLPVDQAYRLIGEIKKNGNLTLSWQIAEGYYLYKKAFKVSVNSSDQMSPLKIGYPTAVSKTDEFFGNVKVYYRSVDLNVSLPAEKPIHELAVTYQGCADAGLCYPPKTEHLRLDIENGEITTFANYPFSRTDLPEQEAPLIFVTETNSLLLALCLAFMGGIILNAMPCVFPVLSLKVLSFASGDSAEHRRQGLAYLSGVIVSFLFIASMLISLQSAGKMVGWGFQLQSTAFVIVLAYLFTLMGLSLSGLILIGGNWMNIGSSLAATSGLQGSFFTGILAVVVASPCTAPFMGSALGFALTQPPHVALTIFFALGLGMASPMVALSISPSARRYLPTPGAWMEQLKKILAFPMYLTVVWLLWVIGKQAGIDKMVATMVGLVLLALGITLFLGGRVSRALGSVCLVCSVTLAWFQLENGISTATERRDGILPWSAQALNELRQQGKPVFVDVTADWCITCKANEKAVLFTEEMKIAFASAGITYMVADWTTYDSEIGGFVRNLGRNGIPLYVFYPAGGQKGPMILPQILTARIVMETLNIVVP